MGNLLVTPITAVPLDHRHHCGTRLQTCPWLSSPGNAPMHSLSLAPLGLLHVLGLEVAKGYACCCC